MTTFKQKDLPLRLKTGQESTFVGSSLPIGRSQRSDISANIIRPIAIKRIISKLLVKVHKFDEKIKTLSKHQIW